MAPIRIGFVGLSSRGWASSVLAPPLFRAPLSDLYTLTALSTTSAQSASAAAEIFSKLTGNTVKAYHGDTSEIAGDPDVDFVAIAVKTPDHRAAVMPAIERGKDIFLEWPLGNGMQETIDIAEAAKSKGVRTMVGLQSWQSPVVRKIKDWVSSGKIGRVLSVSWVGSKTQESTVWAPLQTKRDAYVLDPSNGATVLHVALGHNLSAITYALGPLSSISATSAQMFNEIKFVDSDGKPTGETTKAVFPDQFAFSGILKDHGAILTATWRGGITSTKESDRNRPTLIWLIDGEDGHIRVESYHVAGSLVNIFSPEKVYLNGEEVSVGDGQDSAGNIEKNWAEFAKGKEGSYPTFEDAVVVYKHVDAIETSAREGRRVDLDI
ncbi:hypothetical protein EW146_g2745 [Bondarzewia mesenterica]|uniref:Uncharacterized protein n=1 Tax=Bondarzewia mesenterica TaxID=1095465 RepID=A0A4S4M5X6_9AGAM|nr:hypothetical protein EW146_g2745 [Bondarzewia mesenterica]